MPVGEAVADRQHHVGGQERPVARCLGGLNARRADIQGVVEGDGALRHVGAGNGDVHVLRKGQQLRLGAREQHAPAHQNQRALRPAQHGKRRPERILRRVRSANLHRNIALEVEIDFAGLHIERQVDHDGAGLSLPGPAQREQEFIHRGPGIRQADGVLGDGRGDARHVDALKRVFAELAAVGLPGDRHERNRIDVGRVEARHEIRGARAGGAQGKGHLPAGPVVSGRRVDAALLVAHGDVPDLALQLVQGAVQAVDPRAGNPEGVRDALPNQDRKDGLCQLHSTHALNHFTF